VASVAHVTPETFATLNNLAYVAARMDQIDQKIHPKPNKARSSTATKTVKSVAGGAGGEEEVVGLQDNPVLYDHYEKHAGSGGVEAFNKQKAVKAAQGFSGYLTRQSTGPEPVPDAVTKFQALSEADKALMMPLLAKGNKARKLEKAKATEQKASGSKKRDRDEDAQEEGEEEEQEAGEGEGEGEGPAKKRVLRSQRGSASSPLFMSDTGAVSSVASEGEE